MEIIVELITTLRRYHKYNYNYESFSNPVLRLNKSSKFDLTLIPSVTSNYALDYFVDVVANNSTYRTININVPYSYKSKKIFNIENTPLAPATQGVIDTYRKFVIQWITHDV